MYHNIEEIYYRYEKEKAMEGFIDLFMHDNRDKNKLRKFDMYYVKKYLKSAKEVQVVDNLDEIIRYFKDKKSKIIQDIVNLVKEYDSIAGPMLYKACIEMDPNYNSSKEIKKLDSLKDKFKTIIKSSQPALGKFVPYTGDKRALLEKLELVGIDYYNDNLNKLIGQSTPQIKNVLNILYGSEWDSSKLRSHWDKVDNLDGNAYDNFHLLYSYGCSDGDDGGGGIPEINDNIEDNFGITGADCVLLRRK